MNLSNLQEIKSKLKSEPKPEQGSSQLLEDGQLVKDTSMAEDKPKSSQGDINKTNSTD